MEQKILIFKILFNSFFFTLLFFNVVNAYAKNITIYGKAKVVDGDTIHVDQHKIRLYGIDAPEKNQKCTYNNKDWECGIYSTNALIKLINNNEVKCQSNDIDRYKRFIAICFVEKNEINKLMVKKGWALAYRYYSRDYIDEEFIAKKNKLGIWKGQFEEPYKFRKKNK